MSNPDSDPPPGKEGVNRIAATLVEFAAGTIIADGIDGQIQVDKIGSFVCLRTPPWWVAKVATMAMSCESPYVAAMKTIESLLHYDHRTGQQGC